MQLIYRRKAPFSIEDPYRSKRPSTSKIIFLSCEGSATEEEYIEILSRIYDGVKNKIQLISVAKDEIHTAPKGRTREQNQTLGKSKLWQLVERIDKFKQEKEPIYEFSKYPDDEFWIVSDIDDNLDNHLQEFKKAIEDCDEKGYKYAISNPFFEVWLLLHHDKVWEEDKKYAVTEKHPYEPTDHFRNRLAERGAALKEQKHLNEEHYSDEKIRAAVQRAKELQKDSSEKYPKDYGTHVFKIIDEILEIVSGDGVKKE
jgi:hypothetical protein